MMGETHDARHRYVLTGEEVIMFEQELQFFIRNQNELVSKYGGKTLIIKQDKVIGAYDSVLEAYLFGQKTYEPGTYMIQECRPGEDAYTVTISPALSVFDESNEATRSGQL